MTLSLSLLLFLPSPPLFELFTWPFSSWILLSLAFSSSSVRVIYSAFLFLDLSLPSFLLFLTPLFPQFPFPIFSTQPHPLLRIILSFSLHLFFLSFSSSSNLPSLAYFFPFPLSLSTPLSLLLSLPGFFPPSPPPSSYHPFLSLTSSVLYFPFFLIHPTISTSIYFIFAFSRPPS